MRSSTVNATAAASWRRNFCRAVSPLVGVMAQLLKVIHKANGSKHQSEEVHEEIDKVPRWISSQPAVTMATPIPRINISPPMVGVPCLDMCQVGPSSRMLCPAFHLRSRGSKICPCNKGHSKGHDKAENI